MLIGAVVVWFVRTKKGRMCPHCISSTFWTYTLATLALGWWGIVSFFLTPFIVVMNVISYRCASLSPAYPEDPVPTVLSSAQVRNLEPYRDEIFQRLLKGELMEQVAADIGNRVGATPAEVRAFYNNS